MRTITKEPGRTGYEDSTDVTPAIVLLLGCALLLNAIPTRARQQFEPPPTLRASEILPPELLSGPEHRVAEQVANDGFMNIYSIESRFGTFTANSTDELLIRVDEIDAIARMEEWSESEQFIEGVGKAGRDVLGSSFRLVTDPFGTFRGTTSGVFEIFASARRSISGTGPVEADLDIGDTVVDLIGYSRARRQYAAAFEVDPYSTNPVLQDYLDHLARIGFVGQVGGRTARGFVDGGVGIAISVAGYLHSLEEQVRDRTPEELREANEEKLQTMNVEQSVIDLFLGNYVFTPTFQTAFVDTLEEIDDADGRGEFLKTAVLAKNEDQALFRLSQARMYANYHETVAQIREFVLVSELMVVAARNADGALVVNVPADHVSFSSNLAAYFTAARSRLDEVPGVEDKQLWVAGGMSPMAREWIEESGWTVQTDTRSAPISAPIPED